MNILIKCRDCWDGLDLVGDGVCGDCWLRKYNERSAMDLRRAASCLGIGHAGKGRSQLIMDLVEMAYVEKLVCYDF